MTSTVSRPSEVRPPEPPSVGGRLLYLTRTTGPKDIGVLYLVTSFGFFLAAGAMAMLIRGSSPCRGSSSASTSSTTSC